MFKRAVVFIGWAILAAIVGLLSFVLVTVRQGWEYAAVGSGSMEPAFHVGGLVVIKPIDPDTLAVGDVISFKYPGIDTSICHRIISIDDSAEGVLFQTKGDANESADEQPVSAAMVKGKAAAFIPYVGRLVEVTNLGRQPVGLLGFSLPLAVVVVFAAGAVFIFMSIKDAVQEVSDPARKMRLRAASARQAVLDRRKKYQDLM